MCYNFYFVFFFKCFGLMFNKLNILNLIKGGFKLFGVVIKLCIINWLIWVVKVDFVLCLI